MDHKVHVDHRGGPVSDERFGPQKSAELGRAAKGQGWKLVEVGTYRYPERSGKMRNRHILQVTDAVGREMTLRGYGDWMDWCRLHDLDGREVEYGNRLPRCPDCGADGASVGHTDCLFPRVIE